MKRMAIAISIFSLFYVGFVFAVDRGTEDVLTQARKALDAGKWSEALKLYNRAVSLTKGSEAAMWGKGQVFIRKGDYRSAKSFCRSFINKNRKSPYAHACLGYTHLIWHRYSLAEKSFSDALALDPNFAPAIAGYGKALMLAGKMEEAKEKFREALTKNPEEVEAAAGLVDIFLFEGKRAQAIEIIEPLAGKLGEDPVFLFAYAKALGKGNLCLTC